MKAQQSSLNLMTLGETDGRHTSTFVHIHPCMISLPSPPIFFTLLGMSEIGLALFKRSGNSAQSKDGGSFGMLWAVIGISIYLAIHGSYAWPQFSYPYSVAMYLFGALLFVLGSRFAGGPLFTSAASSP